MTRSTINDIKINYIDIGSRGSIVKPWSRRYIGHLLSVDPLSKDDLPFCIFTDDKQRDFYVLKKEQCSSLFYPDYKFIKKHFGVIKNKYRIKKQILVQCKRMDSILEHENIKYDFMKIDTQGADLQVIQSCGQFLNNLIGIHLEAFFIPFYNEEKNVSLLAAKIDAVFDTLNEYDHECVFVNDGSTDATRDELDRLRGEDDHVHPLHLVQNRGQSAALVAGMRHARGAYILTLDGDLQNDPSDFPEMLRLLQEYDCVCGYRVDRQDTWLRKAASRVANKVRRWVLDDGIRDSGCGSKGFRKSCVPHIISFNGVHRFFAVVVRMGGLTVTECPVTHHPRVHGASKYGIHNRLWRGIYDLIGVRWLEKRYVTYEIEGEQ